MKIRIILISNDSDFFEYIIPMLNFRKFDEVYTFSYDEIPENLPLYEPSLFILNSEGARERVLEFLDLLEMSPAIVFAYNDDSEYRKRTYLASSFGFITMQTDIDELEVRVLAALNILSNYEKKNLYRNLLVKNNIIKKNNEVFLDYEKVLDSELEYISKSSAPAVLAAISTDNKTRLILNSAKIETVILSNIRENDILIKYSINKYLLLLHNINIKSAELLWNRITGFLPEKLYAGMTMINSKTRTQIIDEADKKLQESINNNMSVVKIDTKLHYDNFKEFRKEFNKKLENILAPVFYHVQQKIQQETTGMQIQSLIKDGHADLTIQNRYFKGLFAVSCPGAAKVNIDISFQKCGDNGETYYPKTKRITLEPEELEAGLIEDILEQFISEVKKEV